MNSYTKLLTQAVLIKDFGHFKKDDWLMFENFDNDILEHLTKNRHSIQLSWEVTTKFSLDRLRLSFYYENDKDYGIIENSTSFQLGRTSLTVNDLGKHYLIPETKIEMPECLIDRSFYNNQAEVNISEDEHNLIELYQRIFKKSINNGYINKNNTKPHNIEKYNFIQVDEKNNLNYIVNYSYYYTTSINTGMGSKGFYQHTSTGDISFKEKIVKMIEDNYTIPLLNKRIIELNDEDVLILEMHNT
jgi:hypothetical protein